MKINNITFQLNFLFFCIILLFGCEPKLLEVDIPNQKYSTIINSLLIKDSIISVNMGKNIGILLKNRDLDSNNAEIKIKLNGGNEENLKRSRNEIKFNYEFDSYVSNDLKFNSNNTKISNVDEIKIEASAKGFETDYGNFKFEIEDVQAEIYNLELDSINQSSFFVDITNNPTKENGFIIELYNVDSLKNYSKIITFASEQTDNNFFDNQGNEYTYFNGNFLFSDKFNTVNSVFRKKFFFNSLFRDYNNSTIVGYDTTRNFDGSIYIRPIFENIKAKRFTKSDLVVKITQVDENYLKYVKTALSQIENQFNPFAEPVFVFSNLPSRKGIVGMASKKLIYFK